MVQGRSTACLERLQSLSSADFQLSGPKALWQRKPSTWFLQVKPQGSLPGPGIAARAAAACSWRPGTYLSQAGPGQQR